MVVLWGAAVLLVLGYYRIPFVAAVLEPLERWQSEKGASAASFVLRDCLTILLSNWIVWIPVMLAVYAFPTPLQVQLVGLASSFWMLVALKAGGPKWVVSAN